MEGDRTSADLSAALLDSLDVIAWIAEPDPFRITYVNQRGAASLGYPRENWVGGSAFWSELIHPLDREEMLALCSAVAREGAPRELVHRVRDASGAVLWFRTRVTIFARASVPTALLGQMTDVTEIMQRQAPGDRDIWLQRMMSQLPVLLWTVDTELRFTFGAGAGLARMGLTPNELLGLSLVDYFGVTDIDSPRLAEHRRALAGESVSYRSPLAGAVYDLFLEPLRDGTGKISGVAGVALDVTEAALSQERYRRIVETAEEGIWMIDGEGKTTFVNPKMANMLGYTAEEMVGRSMFDFMDEAARVVAANNMNRRRQGIREVHDFRWRRKDASELWVSMSTSPIFDEEGQFQGALAMSSDITEKRRAEAERERLLSDVNARRMLLELVVRHAPMGILLLRKKDFLVEVANPAVHAMMPGRQIEGLRWYDDVAPELAAKVRPQVEEVLRSGKPQQVVDAYMPIRRSTGGPLEPTWVTSSRVPIILPDGAEGILLMFVDSTSMVRAREEITRLAAVSSQQSAQLQAILDNMTDAVVACDAAGLVVFANRACTEWLGVPSWETNRLPRSEFLSVMTGTAVDDPSSSIQRALGGEMLPDQEHSFMQAGTGRPFTVRTSTFPLRDGTGKISGAILVARDVTNVALFERLKDEFIGVAAHELKTPVAIMKANAQLLQSLRDQPNDPLTHRRRKMTEAIDRGANRIDKVVQDLLDISQLRMNTLTLRFEEVEVGLLAQRAIRHGSRNAIDRIRLHDDGQVLVRGDPHRLEWVLVHLLDNAIRYSPDGGPIDVRVTSRDGGALVSVQDAGVGIAPDRQGRIFERFFRGHTGTPYDYGGLGVSLYIAREIVRQHGGEIWFESDLGHGSTFHLSLPRGEPHVPARGG